MSKPDDPLWQRLEAMNLDEADIRLPFSARLARENGWDEAYARRVVEEYKRFVYLAAVSDRILTPSDDVDQAWHLHLLYSDHYWNVMCKEVLQTTLHHGPTRGGPAETKKYKSCYARMLDGYERSFGKKPPADIWPSVKARFADVESFRRVNTATHFVVPKSRAAAVAGSVTTLGLAGCAAALEEPGFFLAVFAVIVLVLVIVAIASLSKKKKRGGRNGGCGGCGAGGGGGRAGKDSDGDAGCGGCGGCG